MEAHNDCVLFYTCRMYVMSLLWMVVFFLFLGTGRYGCVVFIEGYGLIHSVSLSI